MITRILKCLGDFKLEDYQFKWLEFLYIEIFENCDLKDLWSSYAEHWIHTLKDENRRKQIIEKIKNIIQNLESSDITYF